MLALNLAVLAAVTGGFWLLVIAAVNRLHGRRLSHRVLHQLHHIHDILILGFPAVLVWCVGWHGPRLLRGGSLADLPLLWQIVFALCITAALAKLSFIVYRRWRGAPSQQVCLKSRTLDIAQRLGFRPVGPGPYAFMARLPGNQLFQLEITEKEFRLPRCPPEWDGLSILHLTDLHFIGTIDRPYFDEVLRLCQEMQPDLIVFTGDLLDDMRLTTWLPETLGKLTAPLGRYFILGNHDWYLDPDAIRRTMCGLGWIDVAARVEQIEYRGHPLAISGSEWPWMGLRPDLLQLPDDTFQLLLSHTPDNLEWAARRGVDLMLSGHNHGGQVRLPLFGPLYSPSKYGCKYASGVFWHAPTLLHVGRGLAGRHPLRIGCLPEVTKVVLRSGGVRQSVGWAVPTNE